MHSARVVIPLPRHFGARLASNMRTMAALCLLYTARVQQLRQQQRLAAWRCAHVKHALAWPHI